MAQLDAERVKECADIVRVVGDYVRLKRGGNANEMVGLCPFHKERTPSFTITRDKQLFYCFGCQANGDVFDFVRKIEGLAAFGDAVKRVAELVGIDPADGSKTTPKPPRARVPEPDWEEPKQAHGKIVATYPYTDEHGKILYEVCRLEPKSFRQRRPDGKGGYTWDMNGLRRVLYRLPEVLRADTVYVVEGEKDVHTLEAAGVVATTNSGGAHQKWQPEWTKALAGRRVIVIPDNDEPGKKRAATIVKELTGQAAEVIQIELPVGKDVTDFFEAGHTLYDLEQLVDEARRAANREVIERRGLLDPREIIEYCDGGISAFLNPSKRQKGIETGFRRFDEMTLGMHPGELIILAARPAMGKTALALNIAANVASRGKVVAIFSLEMSRESMLTRVVCARARVDQMKFRAGFLNRDERDRIRQALSEVCDMPLFIDDHAAADLKTVHAKLANLRARKGLDLVVIDYLQLMTVKARENRNQEVNSLSRGLKLMAREFKVPFLVLSQLSRAPEQRPGNHRPQLSDLRDSGGIEQDCDVCAFIFREEVYKPDREDLKGFAELIVAKQRNGPVGTVKLTFLRELTKFENYAGGGHE